MSAWLLDASVLIAREDLHDAHHRDVEQLLAGSTTLLTLDLAFYEVTNVAVRSWGDEQAAARLRAVVTAISAGGGLVRVDDALAAAAASLALEHELSAYDAAYVAATRARTATLVSCDMRDLVDPGLAITPAAALERRG